MSRGDDLHNSVCPGCDHRMALHARQIGCLHGWTYDAEGRSQTEGCECPMTLAGEHNPPDEKDVEWDPDRDPPVPVR